MILHLDLLPPQCSVEMVQSLDRKWVRFRGVILGEYYGEWTQWYPKTEEVSLTWTELWPE